MNLALPFSFGKNATLRALGVAALLAGGALMSGCTVTPATGTIVADWTIADGKDPASCTATGTALVRVDVYNHNGTTRLNSGSDTQDCSAFATTIVHDFAPGTYDVEVTMLAADGTTERTTTATTSVDVVSDAVAVAAVNFSLASFK